MSRLVRFLGVAALVAAFLVPTSAAHAAPTAYVLYEDGTIKVGTVDLGAGAPDVTFVSDTGISASGVSIGGVALNPAGDLVAIDTEGDRLLVIDPTTGDVLADVALDHDFGAGGPAVASDGRIFVAGGTSLYEVDPQLGEVTEIVEVANSVGSAATICADRTGTNFVYVWSNFNAQLYVVSLSPLDVITLPNPAGVPVNSARIGFDSNGTLWALNANVVTPAVFTLDLASGVGTSFGSTQAKSFEGLAIAPTTCPTAPPDDIPSDGGGAVVPVGTTPNFTG